MCHQNFLETPVGAIGLAQAFNPTITNLKP